MSADGEVVEGTPATTVMETVPVGIKAETDNLITMKLGHLEIPEAHLNSWDFDALQYSAEELILITPYFFQKTGTLREFNISEDIFGFFVRDLSSKYLNENSYHNYSHALDVLHAVYHLTMVSHMHKAYSKLEIFSLMVASVAHGKCPHHMFIDDQHVISFTPPNT